MHQIREWAPGGLGTLSQAPLLPPGLLGEVAATDARGGDKRSRCHPYRRPGWSLSRVICWLPAWLGQHAVCLPNELGLPGEPGALAWDLATTACLLANMVKQIASWAVRPGCWQAEHWGPPKEVPSELRSKTGLPPSDPPLASSSGAGCRAAKCSGHQGLPFGSCLAPQSG